MKAMLKRINTIWARVEAIWTSVQATWEQVPYWAKVVVAVLGLAIYTFGIPEIIWAAKM